MSLTTIQYEELAERIELILQDPERAFDHIRDERIRRRLADLQLPLALIGVETGLFAALAAEPRSFNTIELAKKTGVDCMLLSSYSILHADGGILMNFRETTAILPSY